MPKSEHRSEHSLSRSYREVTVHSDGRSGTMSKSIAGGRRKTASEANAATVSTAHVGQAVQVAVALLIPVLLLAAIITYDLVTVTKLNQDQTNATNTANHALDLDDCAMAVADELYTILDRNINLGAAMEFRLAAARTATTQACAQPLYSETAGYFENVMTPLATVRANAASLGALSITLSWTNVNIAVLRTATALLDSLPPAVLPNATVGRQTSLLGNLYVYLSALSYFQWLGRTVVQIDNTIFSLNAASLLTAAQLVYPSTTSPYNTFVVRNCINAVMVPLPQYGDPTAARACLPALASLRLIRESVRNSVQTVHSDASTWYTSRIGPISGITFIAIIVIVVAFVSIFFAQRATTRDLQEELINRKNTMESIQAFVPAQFLVFLGIRVITELTVDDPQEIQLTVLSSDIRAFTSISEQMTDVELFFWLQEHLELMTSACRRAGGFIEKYIGDAVLCLFEHSADAIRCGIDMQYTVDEANASRVARGEEYMVRVGVGIHTGNTLLGVVGDEKCQNTSVVSRAVDMSAKLEELTKVYGAKIIVSETTFDDAAMVIGDTRRLGEFKYDGQSVFLREIYVTETHAIRDYKNGSKKNFEAAVAARDRGNISEANMYFDRVLAFPKPRGYEDLAAVKVMEF